MKRTIFTITVLTLLIASSNVLGWKETEISRVVPLPPNIQVIPPSADCPKEIAAFSGRWEGIWKGFRRQIKSVLIVEEINSQQAKVIIGWTGEIRKAPDYERFKAKVIPGGIIQFSGPLSNYSFEISKDLKTIHGTFKPQKDPGNQCTITMEKVDE